jgi:hypothetical protein
MKNWSEFLPPLQLAHRERMMLLPLIHKRKREDALLMLAVMHEIERAPIVASEPMLAAIRLAWWREAITEVAAGGQVRKHPLVEALAQLHAHQPDVAPLLITFLNCIAYEAETTDWPVLDAWRAHIRSRARAADRLWGMVAGHCPPEEQSYAFACVLLARNLPRMGKGGCLTLPSAFFAQAKLAYTANALAQPSLGLCILTRALIDEASGALNGASTASCGVWKGQALLTRALAAQLARAEYNPYAPVLKTAPISAVVQLLAISLVG